MLITPRMLAARRESGFTVTELVATMVIIGVLAAVAIPRFITQAEFDAFGFAEQTRAALRYAHKSAIAKRRQVCVDVVANQLSLRVATTFRAASCDETLVNPADGNAYMQTAPRGVTISSASFSFDELGRPGAATALSIAGGALTQVVTVEAETGYVH